MGYNVYIVWILSELPVVSTSLQNTFVKQINRKNIKLNDYH